MTAEITGAEDGFHLAFLAGTLAYVALTALAISRFLIRMAHEPRERRRLWQTLVGATVGIMAWSTGMLIVLGHRWSDGQGGQATVGFDVAPLALALALAIGLCVAVFNAGLEGERSVVQAISMGSGSGAAGLAVYLLALEAMHAPGRFQFDPLLGGVAAGFALGAFGYASLLLHGPERMIRRRRGVILIQVSILGMTGFAAQAIEFAPDPDAAVPAGLVDGGSLGFMVGAISALCAAITFLFSRIDLASARAEEEKFRHLALHDPLTGLPNRAFLAQALERMLEEARGRTEADGIGHGGATLAVVGVDLDRFKPINDVQGHAAGDAVLQGIAQRVRAALAPGEVFARAGGDEFVALKFPCAREEAERFARRLHDAIVVPIDWAGSSLGVGASLGIALHPRDGEDAGALLTRVDLALYRAKKEAGGEIVFYDRRMDEASRDRSALAMELRQALARGEFELRYQPQTSLGDGAVIAYEALIRWRHPERGLLAPDAFIPVAESTGLIRDIGAWVLHAACREAAAWIEPVGVAVNVAPVQLAQSDFVELVRDALLASGLEAGRLELEVTEASMIADHEQLRAVMIELKAIGVRVAMDDYGAGYASLAALRSFPFDKIKIDRGFVESLGRDPQSLAIVRSTLLLGRALSIPVLAEGISSEDGLRFLREEGCTEGQGFLFGRPIEAEAVRRRMGMAPAGPAASPPPDAGASDPPPAASAPAPAPPAPGAIPPQGERASGPAVGFPRSEAAPAPAASRIAG
ncbi:putative bifunctional diguanylate cyclase/phosphodiesterase [Albimonas pacifica]|uniref:Diguanylate cyclase (GGDEF) domain-containing protein n=1 Tax=Albimonas pacifica TaxID=1114924 RepID=A0A1I3H119_9RHOB|nr:EAL domain-containing protein [Albimonas pacifica]SFI29381.1 diguanylate cyclase (GGDEF) domain-containing protein [Albimonas pacifica]